MSAARPQIRAGVLAQLLLQNEASVCKGIVWKSHVLRQYLRGLFAKVCDSFWYGQPRRLSSLAAGLVHEFEKVSMVLGKVLVLPPLFATRDIGSARERRTQKG